MHEVSIMGEVFEIIEDNVVNHNIKKVNKVIIDIGEFTCVEESALRFSFDTMKIDTACEDSDFIINKIPATAKCDDCGEVFNVSYTNKLCSICNKFSNNILTGYELSLQTIEGE
jgi:hydrogenase nickel incorporation protein HypA/HybF